VRSSWTPGSGDVVSVVVAGTRRPALVLSPAAYSARVGCALLCPVASPATGYPFEVPLPDGLPLGGVVLADRVWSLDWRAHGVRLVCAVPDEVVVAVRERLLPLVASPTPA